MTDTGAFWHDHLKDMRNPEYAQAYNEVMKKMAHLSYQWDGSARLCLCKATEDHPVVREED